MKLIDALKIVDEGANRDLRAVRVGLICGFAPTHFQTFLGAHFCRAFKGQRAQIESGLYGDLWGNLARLETAKTDAAIVAAEWADFDGRLGLRGLGSWAPTALPDILESVRSRTQKFLAAVQSISTEIPVAVSLPTLPVPPVSFVPTWQGNACTLELRSLMASLACELVRLKNAKLVDTQRLDCLSPLRERFDPKTEMLAGLPYRLPHASILAELLVRLIAPAPAKKGVITDLDDTLWSGILGEVGLQGINWALEHKSHMHGAYQRFLHALAETGVLVGVASKNDPNLVREALSRDDLILPGRSLFPVEASWGPKSAAVARILRTWNIAADAVIFIDDSPMEIAEVQAHFPEIEAILFPKNDYQALNDLFYRLRDLCGKTAVSKEDTLRAQSIRRAQDAVPINSGQSVDEFLEQAEAHFEHDFSKDQSDDRAFELLNKTNQFNLNGIRLTEPSWNKFLKEPDTFLLATTYRDKYGPLGKIAVLAGRIKDNVLTVENWVMSCRAFSRRVEHHCLHAVMKRFNPERIVLHFEPTPRNGPVGDFLSDMLGERPAAQCEITQKKALEFLEKRMPATAELTHG
ncbi:MAG: HAD-IIIC family phosphatase [Terriglobales bacterium]|jgi:FkbH-like protein